MIQIKDDKKYFIFEIVDYQYLLNTDNPHDLNWLIIHIKADNGRYQWEKSDPAILAGELEKLYIWFNNISLNKKNKSNEIRFIEPLLRFKIIDDDYYRIYLRIYFDAEFIPDNFNFKDTDFPESCFIDLTINKKELGKIANGFKIESKKFPVRGAL